MIIAINTRHEQLHNDFIIDCFSLIATKYPQHHFLFIFDKVPDQSPGLPDNITRVVTGPKAVSPLRWQYWYNFRIPAILRKYKADVFVSLEGICSMRTKVPQCLLLHDSSFLNYPVGLPKSHLRFYKKYTAAFLKKAKGLATHSFFSRTVIANQYRINEAMIDVIPMSVGTHFQPCSQEEKEKVKNQYTEGKEFFLFAGNISAGNNPIELLRAFSFFKKRQKSNMQLLIIGKPGTTEPAFLQSLKTFKFKNDVKLPGALYKEEQARIMAAAYAFVYPANFEDFPLHPLEAMECEVPVITGNAAPLQEACGSAALYANSADYNDIADKMMLLFKDEQRRSELIQEGKKRAKEFSRENTAGKIWQFIAGTIQ